MALTDKLTAIGAAIRNKTGKTALMTLDEMPTEIASIQTGEGFPPEAFNITGSAESRFAYDGWSWFINNYKNRITTSNIISCVNMFRMVKNLDDYKIPFDINIRDCKYFSYMFYSALLNTCPKIRGTINWSISTKFESMLDGLDRLTSFDDLFTPEMMDGSAAILITSAYSSPTFMNFDSCRSMRAVPQWFYHIKLNEASTQFPYNYIYEDLFNLCSVLDEVRDLQVWRCQSGPSTNMLDRTFRQCARLKSITFETNQDGTAVVAQWKNQLLDLTNNVGYGGNHPPSQSGITEDKKVTDDATYQALKDDPDWYTFDIAYCRYNHNSAVETINSLPDTSAYLATAGGTNTIKFRGSSGSSTDGGAISNLTAEEIAVATAKGWTVSLV